LRNLNIDAIAAWAFKGLRIDDLPRSMWYNPQHSTACALGLIAIPVAMCGGLRARLAAIGMAGLALGASVVFNPFVGGVFSIVYGATIAIEAIRRRGDALSILRHALAAVCLRCAGVVPDQPGGRHCTGRAALRVFWTGQERTGHHISPVVRPDSHTRRDRLLARAGTDRPQPRGPRSVVSSSASC
jgi:hypothetical protein